jgi:hypothetical protein
MRNCSARWPAAQQSCSLQLLHLGRVCTPDDLLLSHAAGEQWFLVSSSDATHHRIGLVFVHLYEMYVGVRPSVRLLWLFFKS